MNTYLSINPRIIKTCVVCSSINRTIVNIGCGISYIYIPLLSDEIVELGVDSIINPCLRLEIVNTTHKSP